MASLLTSSTLISHAFNKPHLHKPTLPHLNPTLSFSHLSYPSLRTSTPKFNPLPSIKASSSSTSLHPHPHPTPNPSKPQNPFPSTLLSNSTRSLTTLFALALSLSNLFSQAIQRKITSFSITPSPQELASIKKLQENLVCTMGPLFFAVIRDRPEGVNTPFTVVAAGMSKWLDIYSGVLMVRVLLSWFPNIPWDRQPLSAIRDLCDPYLNLFRNIIPPVFDTLDVSPLLAFAVLGVLGAILNGGRSY